MPNDSELDETRGFLLRACATPGSPWRAFMMTDANIAAAKKLEQEGLVETSTGEVYGVLWLGVRLTSAGVEYRQNGGR